MRNLDRSIFISNKKRKERISNRIEKKEIIVEYFNISLILFDRTRGRQNFWDNNFLTKFPL